MKVTSTIIWRIHTVHHSKGFPSPDCSMKFVESPNIPTVPGPAALFNTLLNMMAPDATPNPNPATIKHNIAH